MGRFLVLVAIVVALAWLLRRALARVERERNAGGTPSAADPHAPGDLVRCAHCGVHLPRAEARESAGALYCGDDHAARGPGAPS